MISIETSIEIGGDRDLFERVSNTLRNPRVLMERIGVFGMSSAVLRLESVLSSETDAIRSGKLGASIDVGSKESKKAVISSANTIFELSNERVVIGSNLPYAAQVQFGGTIVPKQGKALAIPLTDQLKRAGLSPRDVDPSRELLEFIPSKAGGKGIGVLVDPGRGLEGRQRKVRGVTPYGPGPLFLLVRSVTQAPRPFLGFDQADKDEVEVILKEWLEEKD